MELLLLGFLPLLVFGIFRSDDDEDDESGATDPRNDILRDGDEASTLDGGDGSDLILGAGGGDVLSGDDGMDAVSGETGPDTLFGGTGEDLLLGVWGQDQLYGGADDDALIGGSGDDDLNGGGGDDFMVGSSGADTLQGDEGGDGIIGIDARAELGIEEIILLDQDVLDAQLEDAFGDDLRDSDVNRVVVGIYNADEADQQPDLLYGGAGADLLAGDNGDVMIGGDGVDSFQAFAAEGDEVTTILDFDPTAETLELLVVGPATAVLTYRDDSFLDGVEVLLDGDVVAYLEGVRASQINPAAIGLRQWGT